MLFFRCLVHLSRNGAEVSMFAPNVDQMHVIDHTKGEPSGEKRCVLLYEANMYQLVHCVHAPGLLLGNYNVLMVIYVQLTSLFVLHFAGCVRY